MDRGLKAAFLFSLVIVAQADRALNAHKASTGGLHGVAVLRSVSSTVGTAAATAAGETTFTTVGNYLITNGNGTWTYSYYANNNNLNGNDNGMGGDYTYAVNNPAFYVSNGALGGALSQGGQVYSFTGGTTVSTAGLVTVPTAFAAAPVAGSTVVFTSLTGAVGITTDVTYYVIAGATTTTFSISTVAGGAAVTPTTGATAAAGIISTVGYSTFLAPSYDDITTAAGPLVVESPIASYTAGITDLFFTGAKTGIAVGRYAGFADIDQSVYTNPFLSGSPAVSEYPNILLTYDGAATWVRSTGVPKLSIASGFGNTLLGTFGSTSVPPYPTVSVGDLTSVFFASKSLGWAVGGNDVSFAALQSAVSTTTTPGVAPITSSAITSAPLGFTLNANTGTTSATQSAFGTIFMTMNGGSVWKVVPIWISYSSLLPLWKNNDPSIKVIYQTPIPGILFGVNSDASGKHVYAVGSPSSVFSSSVSSATYITANTQTAAGYQVKPYGTILYSGNSGMSWVQQVAPTLYGGTAPYALFDVAVQKGTTAIAVGGSPSTKFGSLAAGTIIYTTNGGFSWNQAVYQGSTGSKAPVFTCVAYQPSSGGVQMVWVGGFTVRYDGSMALIPTSAAIGTIVAGATVTVGSSDYFPVAASSGYTTVGATTVSTGSRTKGSIYTILTSLDGKTYTPLTASYLPTGFVITKDYQTLPLATDRSVYGITWDNAMHGWIYGYGYILSTQNGGKAWVYETPSDVGVVSVTPRVTTLASVPTTY